VCQVASTSSGSPQWLTLLVAGLSLIPPAFAALLGAAGETAGVANEGIYIVTSAFGVCVGQSGNITRRFAQHVASQKFSQAEVNAAIRIEVVGGKFAREIAEQLKIDELGGIRSLLNIRNPIGPGRFKLMPIQPYTR
jgi:hypothetical protein